MIIERGEGVEFASVGNILRLNKVSVEGFLQKTESSYAPLREFLHRDMLLSKVTKLQNPQTVILRAGRPFDEFADNLSSAPRRGNPRISDEDIYSNPLTPQGKAGIARVSRKVYMKNLYQLQKSKQREYAFAIEKDTGRAVGYFVGQPDSVRVKVWDYQSNLVIVHNHPGSMSLSPADFLAARNTRGIDYVMAVDKYGNVFSGRARRGVSDREFNRIYDDVDLKVKRYILDTWQASGLGIDGDTYKFLRSHGTNLTLKNRGLVYYDPKINSPYYRRFLEEWEESIRETSNL